MYVYMCVCVCVSVCMYVCMYVFFFFFWGGGGTQKLLYRGFSHHPVKVKLHCESVTQATEARTAEALPIFPGTLELCNFWSAPVLLY